ncbi:MAG: response regulator, partial [Proteobacteria bacterium]
QGLFSVTLQKPLRQSSLYDEIVTATTRLPTLPAELTSPTELAHNKHLRVLVADDVMMNQLLAQKLLEKSGYSVACVSSGKEAVERMRAEKFDLILMDCQMPEMDGYEATRDLRADSHPEIRDVPIVALTANAMAGDQERCFEAGMDDYLSKPLKRERLVETLNRWIGSTRDQNPKLRRRAA